MRRSPADARTASADPRVARIRSRAAASSGAPLGVHRTGSHRGPGCATPCVRGRLSALLLGILGCGPPHVFHKEPERACADVTLAGQEDVAAAAGCRELASVTLRTGMALDLKALGRLETIKGELVVGPSVGFSELALPRLRRVGAVKIVGNGDLHGIFLPALERAAAFEIDGNHALSSISAPRLAAVDGAFAVTDNAGLEVLTVTALAVAGSTRVAGNPKLTLIESQLPGLAPPAPTPEVTPPPGE